MKIPVILKVPGEVFPGIPLCVGFFHRLNLEFFSGKGFWETPHGNTPPNLAFWIRDHVRG